MNGHFLPSFVAATLTVITIGGCQPQQPFYFFEDGDLSHYVGVATSIEDPDLEMCSLDYVEETLEPLTLNHSAPDSIQDISLEEAVQIALSRSRVMRDLGGVAFGPNGAQGVPQRLIMIKEVPSVVARI